MLRVFAFFHLIFWRTVIFYMLIAFGFILKAQAHPHGWVDYRIEVQFDDQTRVVALKENWRLDPFYSLTLIQEMERSNNQSGKAQLNQDIARTLKANQYLTHLYEGKLDLSHRLKINLAQNLTVQRSGKRILISFVLPLTNPFKPTIKNPLLYQIYDPTYFVEFLHDKADIPISMTPLSTPCAGEVRTANPDPRLVAQAAMIDITGETPEDFGRFFTDTGVITCSQK